MTTPIHDGFKLVAVMPPIDVIGKEPTPRYMLLVPKCISHLVTWGD